MMTSAGPVARSIAAPNFLDDLVRALSGHPKQIAPKYFYDEIGSALFDRICELDEYYPTRTELAILTAHAAELAARVGVGLRVIELGSGSGNKTRVLLDALHAPIEYLPVDVSPTPIAAAVRELRVAHPELAIVPVVADFTAPFEVPAPARSVRGTMVYFPGSTIGNLLPDDAVALLRNVRRACGPCLLVVGVDLKKHPARLHAAYNDAAGVTAAFNKNLLARANRELGADFDLDAFAHYAGYNPGLGRIEMQLVSLRGQPVRVAGRSFVFEEGEPLITEFSHKYTIPELERLTRSGGFRPLAWYTDAQRDFAVGLLRS